MIPRMRLSARIRSTCGLLIALVCALVPVSLAASPLLQDRCDRYDPVLVPTPVGRGSPDQRDERLTQDLAQRVARLIRDRGEDVRGTVDIYALPGRVDQLLARTVDSEGNRFVHVVDRDGELEGVWTSHGHELVYLEPVFFDCGDRIMILVYTGGYYSAGLDTYEPGSCIAA